MGRRRIYTDEERKEAMRESQRKWRENHRELALERSKECRRKNREHYKEYEKNRCIEKKGYYHQWYLDNREERLERKKEYDKQYRQNNREKENERQRQYRKTQYGRASNLLNAYNQADKNKCRGKGDLTPQWIVENIFTKPCAHCGKEGWNVIGCNRIDNSKPHTKDNVEPCCFECNIKMEKGTI